MLVTDSSTDILKKIVIKASSLSECLTALSSQNFTDNKLIEDEPGEIERRLDFWCQIAAKGDGEKFKRRLAYDGLSNETVRWLIGKYDRIEPKIPPVWLNTLKQVIETAEKCSSANVGKGQSAIISDRPIPFEEFYLPCLQVAQNLLKDALKEHENYKKLLTDNVQTALERKLLESLAHLFAPTLMQEFVQFRTSGNALRDFFNISVQGASKRDKYQAFLQYHLQDGFLSLFEKYSVLGRLVAIAIDFWVESTSELINRLISDWLAIEQYFSPNQPLNKVVDILVGLSDSHKRGRTVAALSFDTGLKLIYKPKDLALEVAFGDLLKWCNQNGINLAFKFPEVLNCSTHGWVEFIESLSCDTEDEVSRFYQRSGMLMCLIHILEGADCHYENLIASGEYPVLVDMETLLHPTIKNSELVQIHDDQQITQKLATSVLRTALLPMKDLVVESDLLLLDLSGLGKVEEQTVPSLTWKHINTDGMKVEQETINFAPKNNVPTLKGVFVEPKNFINEVVTGFKQMYRWVMEHREQLLSEDSPLMQFADRECRFVFRNTRTYTAILQNSCHPDFMEVGIARSVGLDVLSRGFLTSSNKPDFWDILAAEKQEMEQLDIPMLTVNTSSKHLHLVNGTVIPDLFEKSSFEQVICRIQSLDEADLRFQSQVISFSLCARFLEEPQIDRSESLSYLTHRTELEDSIRQSIKPCQQRISKAGRMPTPQELLEKSILLSEAINIACSFKQQLFKTSNNSVAWLGMGYEHSNQSFHIQNTGLNLYDGCVGVSLFLAALAQVTGDSQWRDLSLITLNPLRQVLESTFDTNHKLLKQLGIGGAQGMASSIYGLVRISQLIDEPALLQEAHQVTALITPEQITSDKIFDIVGGTAGTILGLLSLFAATEQMKPSPGLELAIACGEHLLNHQTGNSDESRAWNTWRDRLLTGFSQGAAGIAYALLRLYAVTQDSRWLEAAQEAIAYEQTMFSPEAQNWLDLRSPKPKFQVSWAQGAPGIALARLGGLSVLDTDRIRQEIAIALDTTQQSMVWGVDSLCWGNFGRIETLLVAAQILNCPDLLTAAHQATVVVLEKAHSQGRFTLFLPSFPQIINPGFFQGLSGIGYQLLRLATPDRLPSVLLWQ
jgi:type 2 lantibiotic biosynthesis protein LanM